MMKARLSLLPFTIVWAFAQGPQVLHSQGNPAHPGPSPYPEITELAESNILFRQLSEDIALFYRNMKTGNPIPPILFYSYRVKPGEDLYGISARFNLSYESITLLNGCPSAKSIQPGLLILVPNLPGVFIAERPENDIEMMIAASRDPSTGIPVQVLLPDGRKRDLRYVPGARFTPIELSYFLGILFRFPLRTGGVVSSSFGIRHDPFGSGDLSFHRGIDLAAPRGTEIIAAREGTVIETGYDPVYGNYVIIGHQGGYETVYGHLETVLVQLNQTVHSRMIIGTVGSSGLSTGPHLHFEIRKNGEAVNPASLLPRNTQ